MMHVLRKSFVFYPYGYGPVKFGALFRNAPHTYIEKLLFPAPILRVIVNYLCRTIVRFSVNDESAKLVGVNDWDRLHRQRECSYNEAYVARVVKNGKKAWTTAILP
jgi:hypothetical protein